MNRSSAHRYQWLAIVAGVSLPTLVTWIYFDLLSGHSLQRPAYLIGKTIQFALPLVWVGLILRQRLFGPKLPRRDGQPWATGTSVALGVTMGMAVGMAMFLIYRQFIQHSQVLSQLVPELAQRAEDLGFDGRLRFVALGVFYSLVHSLMEEYYFRWFVYGQLRQILPVIPSICACGLAFMAHHVIVLVHYFDATPFAYFLSFSIAVGGAIWAWQYERSNSLLGPWLSHLVVDAAIFAIGYDILF